MAEVRELGLGTKLTNLAYIEMPHLNIRLFY